MKNFILIYQNDSNDLIVKQFDTENEAHSFMDGKTNKFVIVWGNIASVDDSMGS